CVACHTVNAADPLKGPFLGNVAKIFPRRELAEAILDPNKSIAQGFATHQFTLKNGAGLVGFVTREGADTITIRDIAGQQQEIRVSEIARRGTLPMSLMPPGLLTSFNVRDFASLLDYLQSLADAAK
ncbi:MAG: heme-binding protein, partial [Opitutaceae bacterium]